MNILPIVSIIIPAYNREDSIADSINSVLQQDYNGSIEIIVIDDGSTDKTVERVEEINDPRIQILFSGGRTGASAARNIGIRSSRSDYIAFLDSDDVFLPNKLTKQISEMERSDAGFSVSNCIKKQGTKERIASNLNTTHIFAPTDLVAGVLPLSASLYIYRKSKMPQFYFEEKLPTFNDFDFALRIPTDVKMLFVAEVLVVIHKTLNGNRLSSDLEKKLSGLKILAGSLGQNLREYLMRYMLNSIYIGEIFKILFYV